MQSAAWNPAVRVRTRLVRPGSALPIDSYVLRRLCGLMRKRYGRNMRPGQWLIWTREWFEAHGLYRLRGTIRYPATAS